MNSSLTLLCIIMASVVALTACYSAIPADMVCTIAKSAVARIKKIKDEYFQMSPKIDFGFDTDIPIEGLNSILIHLSYLQMKLQVSPLHNLRQLYVDLELLFKNLERMAMSLDCPLPTPAKNVHKDETDFPITSNYLILMELQRYLDKLCLNQDKLKSC